MTPFKSKVGLFLRVGGARTKLENTSTLYKDGAVLDEPVLSVNKLNKN